MVEDLESKNGLWCDGVRARATVLRSGSVLGVGRVRLVVESPRAVALRALLRRILGWADGRKETVEHAMQHIHAFAAGHLSLVLSGEGDLPSIARHVHDVAIGDARRFVIAPTVGSRHDSRAAAQFLAIARDDRATLCAWADRIPAGVDLGKARHAIVCVRSDVQLGVMGLRLVTSPALLQIPRLATRKDELLRIVREYANDAIASFNANPDSVTARNLELLAARRPTTLPEIERDTRRLVAIQAFGGVTLAAQQLGVNYTSLSRWMSRRGVPRSRATQKGPRK